MRLYTNCHNCKKEIRFSSWESDRVELLKLKGDKIKLIYKNCLQQQDLHRINRIKTAESKTSQIIVLTIFLVGTLLTFLWIWDYIFYFAYIYVIEFLVGIIGVLFMTYWIIEKDQRKKQYTLIIIKSYKQ